MFNKRGQFYLFAAIIIIGIIFSLATISNSINAKKEDTKADELADAINIELGKLVEYQEIDHSAEPIKKLLEDFTQDYAKEYASQDRTTYFTYIIKKDNGDNFREYTYKYEDGTTNEDNYNVDIRQNSYTVTILGKSKTFAIDTSSPEKTIYFAIYETDNGEVSAWANR